MRDGARTVFLCGLHEVFCDHGARKRGNDRVRVHVQGVRFESGHAVFARELLTCIGDVCFDGSAVQRTLADYFEVFTSLANIHGTRDDVSARGVVDPADSHGCVETA